MKKVLKAVSRGVRNKTARQTLLLFSGQVLAIMLGIITTPVVTRALGPTDYGRYVAALAVVSFVATFFDFGFFVSGSRLLAHSDNREEEHRIFAGLLSLAVIEAVLFGVLI